MLRRGFFSFAASQAHRTREAGQQKAGTLQVLLRAVLRSTLSGHSLCVCGTRVRQSSSVRRVRERGMFHAEIGGSNVRVSFMLSEKEKDYMVRIDRE